jgi:dsDNA-binding SOS-regulon protein
VKYYDNNIWKIGDLMKIVTELYLSKMDIAEEKFEELKQFLEESKKDKFQEILKNREEPEIMGGILKKIIEILYNERCVITEQVK